ncbi:hypothetical protein RA276_28140, partial [Pseudomonas syringae pv. tagetis]|uniref:hypothetical protein n=1 Tax=Pseudomonas syringae group genomosp. 7 TaxID=251699 RepID=UPI00376F8A58
MLFFLNSFCVCVFGGFFFCGGGCVVVGGVWFVVLVVAGGVGVWFVVWVLVFCVGVVGWGVSGGWLGVGLGWGCCGRCWCGGGGHVGLWRVADLDTLVEALLLGLFLAVITKPG